MSQEQFKTSLVPAWRRLRSTTIADCRVFKVRRDFAKDPRDGSEHDFYCLEAPDWINVIPLTHDNHVVMIEQYRHGTDEVTLEVPGGMVDEGESPLATAVRELQEETGYRAPEIKLLGNTRPNPAIQNNWLYIFLARDCEPYEKPRFDRSENIAVRLVPLANVDSLIKSGAINHALVIVAFHKLLAVNGG
jgi:8-oxo-dGTP pyrophosphatase MutT (NUDIX family)